MVGITILHGHLATRRRSRSTTHLPLVGRIVATPDGGDPPYHRIAEPYFESVERMQESLSSGETRAAVVD